MFNRYAVKELNDLRPVALTSTVTKCLEKLIAREIKNCFSVPQDPMQFAYRENRNVEDAIVYKMYTNISIRIKTIAGYYLSISPQLLTPSNHTF